MLLYINSTNLEYLELGLLDQPGHFVVKLEVPARYQQSEKLLPELDKLLKKNKCKLTDLEGIVVANGTGSFSSLRLGITAANALGYALGLPVVDESGQSKLVSNKMTKNSSSATSDFSLVVPRYEQEPNISTPKKKVLVDKQYRK